MARKKGDDRPRLEPVLAMKGTPEWRKWLEDFGNHLGASSTETVDDGLALLAEAKGFRAPPSRTGEPQT